jgi:protocatechuate 3,4-dioxygenase, beta subunit
VRDRLRGQGHWRRRATSRALDEPVVVAGSRGRAYNRFMSSSWTRRRLIGAGATLLAYRAGAEGPGLGRTPAQTAGPFYPLDKPLDQDADLTLVKGRTRRAAGQVVHVMGRVLDVRGEPIAGARIEVWQANAHGRYTHPGDGNSAPLDPNFEGFASLETDADGRYRFKTVKPGAYPAGGSAMRPPHIHFTVAAKSARLTTQMYFPGEPLNAKDFIIGAAREERSLLIADLGPPTRDLEPDSLLARWNIVLATG